MRTSDFSRAPRQAQAEAMVVVETGGTRKAKRTMRAAAQAHVGHCWSTTFRAKDPRGAVTLGVIAYFTSATEAEAFAAGTPGQRTRVFRAEKQGYSNGVWRAEGNVMAHIERFTPVTLERQRGSEPPRVDAPAARTRRRTRRQPSSRGKAHNGSPVSAGAMFVGATRYRGPHSWIVLSRDWYPMVAKMRRMHGYLWHTVYWEAPFTLGTLAFFATRDDLLAFARMPEHRRLMQWITRGTAYGTGGYIRLHVANSADHGVAVEAGPGR